MTFSYSGDPSSSALDEIRFLVGDVDSTDALLQNEEIAYAIASWDPIHKSNIFTASVVASMIAAKFAREVTVSADGVSIQMSELQQKFQTLASDLREQYHLLSGAAGAPDVGGILYSDVPDTSILPLVWAKGMDDNARAGQQDFGGGNPNGLNPLLGGDGGFVGSAP